MTKETQDNAIAPYADVAGDVVGLLGARAQANGDPEMFGAVYGGLLEVYSRAVIPTRPMGAADAFVLQVLESVAYLVSGGVQAQRFRDMALAAIAGSVHVERVVEAMRARQAAESGQEAPEEPDDGEGFKPNPDDLDGVEDDSVDMTADERALPDDMLRAFVVHAAGDPWRGVLAPATGDGDRQPLPGVTREAVQERFDRIHAITDRSTPPGGLTAAQWAANRRRALPSLYADLEDQEGDPRAVLAERERAVAEVVRESLEDQEDQEGDPRAQVVEGRMGYA